MNFLISEIGIIELAASSLTLSIQPWVAVVDMVSARDELCKAIVERFRASKIDIPFPVRELCQLRRCMAGRLFEQALPAILTTTSPRAWAFALIGIHEYLRRYDGDRRASQVREELAGRLLTLYQANRSKEWCWFEESLSYCNAALPHAFLMCGQSIPSSTMQEKWLVKNTQVSA